MNYKKLFLIIFLLSLILIPIFYVYQRYHNQQQIGKQECDKIGFVYIDTFFENKKETIFCQTEQKNVVAKLIEVNNKWERIS